MLRRLRNLWRLSRLEPEEVKGFEWSGFVKPVDQDASIEMQVIAKGEFLPDMTEEEVLEYERQERLGWKNFKLPWKKDGQKTQGSTQGVEEV